MKLNKTEQSPAGNSNFMSYQEQLQQPEWGLKRLEILKRDEYKCAICSSERPQFRNLLKSFGIVSYQQLCDSGYSFVNPHKLPVSFENINFIKNNWLNRATYIGNKDKLFNLEKLNFAFQKVEAEIFGQLKKENRLICFYPETIGGKKLIDLNIHHKYYIIGKKPWEYENSVLVSLCVDCHKQVHEEMNIDVYSERGKKLYTAKTCIKCCGSGYLEEYDYYMHGVCFDCGGEGVILLEEKSSR